MLTSGAIVLADISGYTAFVTTTELEHSHAILAELLETMTRGAAGQLDVAQLEGDAVFWLGGRVDEDLIDLLRGLFVAFHRRLRDMEAVTSCPCRACSTVGQLSVKFVVHWGPFVRQVVQGVDHFVGAENVVAHRLLKNTVPSREYLLATEAALALLPADRAATFVRHEETYDVGPVRCGYLELGPLRERARAYQRDHVDRDEAHLRSAAIYELDRDRLWAWLAEDVHRLGWLAHPVWHDAEVKHIDTYMGARGDVLGGEVHCHHGAAAEKLTLMRVVARHPPSEATLLVTGYGSDHWVTQRFEARADGRTDVEVLMLWEGGLPSDLAHFRSRLTSELARVAAKAEEALGGSR